jgi:sodium/bile acid cotransporter 7
MSTNLLRDALSPGADYHGEEVAEKADQGLPSTAVPSSSSSVSSADDENNKTLDESSKKFGGLRRIYNFYCTFQFPILTLVVIALAKAYPPLGAKYLAPRYTSTGLAVAIIFFLSGLGMRTAEFFRVAHRCGFNAFVQIFNFMVPSSIVFGLTRGIAQSGWMSQSICDGLVVCHSLPMPVNMVMVLSAAAGADEAAAIFNTVVGNVLGIFLTPVLVVMYLGQSGDVPLGEIFWKMVLRVIVPLLVGHVIRKSSDRVRTFYAKYKRCFKATSEYLLLFIIYTVFCETFLEDSSAGIAEVFKMLFFQLVVLLVFTGMAWVSLRLLFPKDPEMIVMAVYGCVQKTEALGVPIIAAIFSGSSDIGIYMLPLLVYFPMQLVVGSMLLNYLRNYIHTTRERLDAEGKAGDDSVAGNAENSIPAGSITTPSGKKLEDETDVDETPEKDERGQDDDLRDVPV